MKQKFYTYTALITAMMLVTPFASSAQTCVYMDIAPTQDLQANSLEVAKLQVFLKDIQGYDIEVTGVYDSTTDGLLRSVLSTYGVTSVDPSEHDVALAGVINAIVCGSLRPVVSEDSGTITPDTAAPNESNEETAGATTSSTTEGITGSSTVATATPPIYSTIDGQQLKGTPVGFVNEFSLPILIVLSLLVSVQIIYMWGVAPRRRMQLIPREFK